MAIFAIGTFCLLLACKYGTQKGFIKYQVKLLKKCGKIALHFLRNITKLTIKEQERDKTQHT